MSNEIKKVIKVKEVMSTEIHYIDGMDTVDNVIKLMRQKNVHTLLVKKRFPDDAVGIVVIQDIIKKVLLCDRATSSVNVYEIMTKPAISVPSDMDIRYAVRMMSRAKIRRAPVQENGQLIGILSFEDLVMKAGLF